MSRPDEELRGLRCLGCFGLWLSTVMAAAGILCTPPIYRKIRQTTDEIREEQLKREIQRRRDKAT